jgi:Tfp pilus assembly protein PilV
MLKPQPLKLLRRYQQKLSLIKGGVKNSTSAEGGFSLLEVLVTILVITGFLLGSLQATVLATLLRVQALDKEEASNWVQQDLELIRFEAFELDKDTSDTDTDGDTEEYITQTATPNTSNCNTYGNYLQTDISTPHPSTASITIDNKDYAVTRTYTASANLLQVEYSIEYTSTHPRYKGATADNEVTSLSTEVIPNAALSCP